MVSEAAAHIDERVRELQDSHALCVLEAKIQDLPPGVQVSGARV